MPKRPHRLEDFSRTTSWKYRKNISLSPYSSDSDSEFEAHYSGDLRYPGSVEAGDAAHCEQGESRDILLPEHQSVVGDFHDTQPENFREEREDKSEDVLQENIAHQDEHAELGENVPSPEATYDAAASEDDASDSDNTETDVEEESLEDVHLQEEAGGGEVGQNDPDFVPYDPPVYNGAPLSLSESMMAILTFVLAHNLTGSCLADLLLLISMHCLGPNLCKSSLYLFHKYFADLKAPIVFHFYCKICYQHMETKNDYCNVCQQHTEAEYFIEMPFIDQLRKLYSRPGFVEKLSYHSQRVKKNNSNIEDIYDGALYKENNLATNQRNISLMWNTDGVSPFKSSNYSIWPFYLTINELPPKNRMLKENMLLAGLWFGCKKPEPNLFMSAFHSGVQELRNGIDFEVPNVQGPYRVQGTILCGTCDAPAKSSFFNSKHHNGFFGCPKCQIKGEKSDRTGNVFVYPYEQNLVLRTDADTAQHATNAFYAQSPVFGIKGPTALSLLVPNFIRSTSIDVMHCVYLGVVKLLMKLWFEAQHHAEVFSLRGLAHVVSNRVASITPPHFVQRLPRSVIDHLPFWKASEFRSWFYYYSLPVLYSVMNQVYFNHYMKLVLGVYLLNQDSISQSDIHQAQELLDSFVQNLEGLYGLKYMTFNVHLLRHLPSVVYDLGPLWVTSCFPYENLNGNLTQLVHGTRHAGLQISSSISIFCNLPVLIRNLKDNSPVKEFCELMGSKGRRRLKINEHIGDCVYSVGRYVKPRNIPLRIQNVIRDLDGAPNVTLFYRLMKKNMLYVSESYSRGLKMSSSCVLYLDGGRPKIGVIHTFVKLSNCHCVQVCECNSRYFAVVETMESLLSFRTDTQNIPVPFVHNCNATNTSDIVEVSCLLSVCFKVTCDERMYVITPVNSVELD